MWWTPTWRVPPQAHCSQTFWRNIPPLEFWLSRKNSARKRATRCSASQAEDGGFWVPRAVLAGFVESVLSGAASRRIRAEGYSDLSRREQEVLDALLENQANKEIANHLNISERTVKFHVSNLLSKFGVRRRADLILLCFQKNSGTP
jgi:DNA-binding NarL/FixJ family response regulator